MKNIFILNVCLLLALACNSGKPDAPESGPKTTNEAVVEKVVPEKITFPSLDSLPITAQLYHKSSAAPVVVLCHQAHYCKFEYAGIAKTLHERGFNCLAIDQRCGWGLVEEMNETTIEALKRKKPIDFLDAEQDIVAAVNFAAAKYKKPVILWGSSYSSTLSLYTAIDNKNVMAVIAFSPGDYFQKEKGSLAQKLIGFSKPMWVTSSKEESKELSQMLKKMALTQEQVHFIPDSAGHHGSRALWKSSENNEEYWSSISAFLEKLR